MSEFLLDHRKFEVRDPGPPLSETKISALESMMGRKLPPQLRGYYLRWNGGLPYPSDVPEFDSVWIRLHWGKGVEAARFGPATDLNHLLVMDSSEPSSDFFRTWGDFSGRIPPDCLCFARDSGGNLFLIGAEGDNLGKIYFWAQDFEADVAAGHEPGYGNVAYVAKSLKDFLLDLRGEPQPRESLDAWVRRVYQA